VGTVINVFAVLFGCLVGYFFQKRIPDELKKLLLQGIGLVTIILGVQFSLKTENIIIPMSGVLSGGVIGYLMKIENGLNSLAEKLGNSFSGKQNNASFVQGFIMASLIFCVGPMTILGAINDGLSGDYHLLAVKSVLDGVTAIALTASLGIGVVFSVFTVIIIQGGFTVFAGYASAFFSEQIINETSAAGGIIIIGLGLVILEIKKIPVANFLPALIVIPVIMKIMNLF